MHLLPFMGTYNDGEGGERRWPHQNDQADLAREMTSGHRQDVFNLHHSDQNLQLLLNLGESISWGGRAVHR